MGLGVPLEQLIPLLLNSCGLLLVLLRPRRHIMECLLGILRVPTELGLLLPKPTCLLDQGSQLGHPLLGDSKLGAHIPVQPGLLDEVVPFHLLLTEEPGFLCGRTA